MPQDPLKLPSEGPGAFSLFFPAPALPHLVPLLVSVDTPTRRNASLPRLTRSRQSLGMLLSFSPYPQESQGCMDLQGAFPVHPLPRVSPHLVSLGLCPGKREKGRASHPGLLRVPDPDTAPTCPVPRAQCPATYLGGDRRWKDGPHLLTPC